MLRIIRNIIKIKRQLPVDCWRYIYEGFNLNRVLLVEFNVMFCNGFGGRQRKLLILAVIFILAVRSLYKRSNLKWFINQMYVALINKGTFKCIINKKTRTRELVQKKNLFEYNFDSNYLDVPLARPYYFRTFVHRGRHR